MSPKPDLILRYMRLEDIPAVMAIDRLAFDLPWSERSYSYEIAESDHSHMVVLELRREVPLTGWRRWLSLRNRYKTDSRILGYGGLWNIVQEAHISTIAVHPKVRGRGWGEILLAGMVRRSIWLQAEEVGLEVRVSNTKAQNLYHKYHFENLGVKPQYYRNNNEDAYDMRLKINEPMACAAFETTYVALLAQHGFVDHYTAVPPPIRTPSR